MSARDDEDARFADADRGPLRLVAFDTEDLRVISALVQDAVLEAGEMRYLAGARRFALLVNRFRWEGGTRMPERVRTMLVVEGVRAVRRQGIDPDARDVVLSLLSLAWDGGEDAAGRLVLTFAGDGAVAVEADALEVVLHDATQPYVAPSGKAPRHPD